MMFNRVPRVRVTIVTALCCLWIGFCGVVHAQAAGTAFVYKIVKEYGPLVDLKRKMGPGDQIEDGQREGFGYIVRAVSVTSDQQLLQLMGTSREDRLSDTQKGILEVYRLGQSDAIKGLNQNAPAANRQVTVNLVDVTGCEDRQKFPALRNDFWPHARKISLSSQKGPVRDIEVLISGVDAQGYGARTPAEMKATFAHEFGHTLDLTSIEMEAYGPDGDHWSNEVITEKAAFSEGFANYISTLLYPSRARDFRSSLQQIQVETAPRTYARFAPNDPQLKATDLLRVEAVNTLILHQITQTLPDGREKVFAAFRESNSWNNGLGKFLQTLIRLYPADASAILKIVDDETCKRLTNAEIRTLLGNSSLAEGYLQTRADPAGSRTQVRNPPAGGGTAATIVPGSSSPPPSVRGRVYKWKDKDGRMHFTDSPPPQGIDYTVMSPQKITPINFEGGKTNPYEDD